MLLHNLQAELAEAILADDQYTDCVQPPQNLVIHQNTMISSLIQTLVDTYPLIVSLMGDEFFKVMAKEYIKRYPSRSGNLYEYGAYFEDFMKEYAPVTDFVYLSEVAHFEWVCRTLSTASDHAGFNPSLLQTLPEEDYQQLHFNLHPASYLMQCQYPLLSIIDLCLGKRDEVVNLKEGGLYLCIFRQELTTKLLPLTEAEFLFLTSLQDGQTLHDALESAFAVDDEFDLETKLSDWINKKILVDCYLEE